MVRPLVIELADATEVAARVAGDLFAFLTETLEDKNRVDIALTGGSLGIATLAAARLLDFNSLNLAKVHIWWGDERFVGRASQDRNDLQAYSAWLEFLKVPSRNVHRFPASDSGVTLEQAAAEFNTEFENQKIRFDLMLLGVGPDGHIASLFPGRLEGASLKSVVGVVDSPKPPPERLSFTFSVINNSAQLWFTVAGAEKAEAVAIALGSRSREVPAGQALGKEKTVWYLDQTASSKL